MKLLLIEDEPTALIGMKNAVESINLEFTLFTANTGEKASFIISAEKPDLIVTDIMLPDMTGLDLIEEYISEGNYQPKVIIVSGFGDFEYARRGIRLGAIDFLSLFSEKTPSPSNRVETNRFLGI